jgi:four helix bundle protein
MGDFKKLEAWKVAHHTACEVYRETCGFPKAEAYGLTAQLRRSAVSVAANIAEGAGRRGDIEFSRFVRMSLGSAAELEYHLILARDIGLIPVTTFNELTSLVTRVQQMLARLNHTLNRTRRTRHSA